MELEGNIKRLKEIILEAQTEAALGGHDLTIFEAVRNRKSGGFEARCRKCGMTTWIGADGRRHSMLADSCPSTLLAG